MHPQHINGNLEESLLPTTPLLCTLFKHLIHYVSN